jgi:hypothetical protein
LDGTLQWFLSNYFVEVRYIVEDLLSFNNGTSSAFDDIDSLVEGGIDLGDFGYCSPPCVARGDGNTRIVWRWVEREI